MEHSTCIKFFIIYSSVVIISFCNHVNAVDEISKSDIQDLTNENMERKRREVTDIDQLQSEEKRQREFIGKRFRDFLGKRSDGLDNYDIDDNLQDGIQTDKRFRHFIGKRQFDGLEKEELQLPTKRLREFIGKRTFRDEYFVPGDDFGDAPNYSNEMGTDSYGYGMPGPVGKRSYRTIDLNALEERLRAMVGKRNLPYLRIGQNLFFRKPKYVRELVGKRSVPFNGEMEEEKRLRHFVGKRMRDFIGKRTDDSNEDNVDKRLREFIGK